ncbi:glycosyltransferase [Pseudomonas sp. FSL R10-0056]|uniref:GDP-mannose-dependent alpha-mannosyltransferase n=2 Tax=Pseudomonas TaxID=286 RepID=A0A5E6YLV8_PSEFL|nr:glycosyltransferase [Pseudomonas sp. FSL R10-0056]MQT67168.1 glycosyltransferase [Pseudomonas sp. FSL R10-0071]MQU48399.1 glycosyltransferase [Pseudomonas sp. FSL A6-1183]PAA16217.1 glycoside hydrolase [Pseudomonas fragi]VVN54830.1 GDP-mannose-dependent alpha-mannosyltransferase [Pseudomonas fluorescens]
MTPTHTGVMTTALHIALVTETFAPEINGVANTLGHLCDGLRARNHRVQLIRPRQSADGNQRSSDDLMLCRGWPLPGYPGLQWGLTSTHRLTRRWCQHPPDVVYIATEGPLGLCALRVARRLGITAVTGFHTNFQQYLRQHGLTLFTRALTHYLRGFHNRSAMTLVPSASQRVELERRHFERLELLPRGVDSQLFSPAKRQNALRQSWGLRENDIALLYVGRLAPEKNLDALKRCFDELQARYPARRFKLIVVGNGSKRASLEASLPEAIFCGQQSGEALACHYASGDVFLFPSLSETFGNVVLEAQASGLGVVAYDEAAAGLHIRHGYNGVLAMPGDEYAWIEAACWLLDDPETLRTLRLNARRHASRQSWTGIVEQFENQLQQARQGREYAAPVPVPMTVKKP